MIQHEYVDLGSSGRGKLLWIWRLLCVTANLGLKFTNSLVCKSLTHQGHSVLSSYLLLRVFMSELLGHWWLSFQSIQFVLFY